MGVVFTYFRLKFKGPMSRLIVTILSSPHGSLSHELILNFELKLLISYVSDGLRVSTDDMVCCF